MTSMLMTKIGSLELKNPVMVASGTYGYGEEFDDMYDISKLGAVVTKGVSLKPREGNPMPRVIEVASGMLNAIGLANVGIDNFLSEKLPFLVSRNATVIVNIFGSTIDEYSELAKLLDDHDGVSAVEVNISCPNVKAGGVQFGTDPKVAAKITKLVKKAFSKTVIVKLSPQVSDICAIAKAVEDAGADALSLINTIPAMAIDVDSRKPVLANITGGMSGPAVKPVALKLVYDVARSVRIPVVGLGGIMTTDDALEFLLAGASAVQIGTANFVNPKVALDVISGMDSYCRKLNLSSVQEVVGALEIQN
ncbi:MAG: dihydroorotate dehydrogenase [Deltaproteobacteria bacterium]|jgi:dihydroorotate dehydrogenase (NAD+) catalytic subunit|nr:dihydroorotate dehydrogenase [Deltaproteobacteria bacterium]